MKVLGLISSPLDPASRARIIQYQPYLRQLNTDLYTKYFYPLKEANPQSWNYKLRKLTGINEWRSADSIKTISRVPLLFIQSRYDIIWQNRLLQLQHSFWEKKLKKPVVFDFDDAIWQNEGEKQVISKIKHSAMVFAGNEYLADFAKKHNGSVSIVPTTVDTDALFPMNKKEERFTIGWIGTESNFRYLELVKEIIITFLDRHRDAQFILVSSSMPDNFQNAHENILFHKWTPASENEVINEFSVGIMPLTNNEWTLGKCSYKALQYLACGKPGILSPVGNNNKILGQTESLLPAEGPESWLNILEKLYYDTALRQRMGTEGRAFICNAYSCEQWAPVILSHFKSLVA